MFELRGRYTILIVTHNMAQARRASDECIFMLLGRSSSTAAPKTLSQAQESEDRRIHRRPVRVGIRASTI